MKDGYGASPAHGASPQYPKRYTAAAAQLIRVYRRWEIQQWSLAAVKPTAMGLAGRLLAPFPGGLHVKARLHFTSGEPPKQVERSTNAPPSRSPKTDLVLLELPPPK